MQTTGFQYPTTVVFNGKVTGNPWSNPENVFFTDGYVAESNVGAGVASDFTIGGYNFSIPEGSEINGIEIQLIGYQGSQTVPQLALTISEYDNTDGADTYYPYTAPFTGFNTVIGSYVIGSSTYLFDSTWTVDQINNLKLNLAANGDISLSSVLVNIYYTPTTPPTPPTPTPGMCIDCSSPIQVQAMYLAIPFLAGQTVFYLKPGSFSYPNGVPVQPGDIGSCGGVIDLVFDEGIPASSGGGFEENVQINLTAGATWTVQSNGVIAVDIVSVNYRGLDYKTPAAHVTSNMSDHQSNSEVVISNNEPYNLQLVRRCQAGTVFSAPITVIQDDDSGSPITTYLQVLNFVTPLHGTLDGSGQVDVSLNVVQLADDVTFTNALAASSSFVTAMVAALNATHDITVVTDGTTITGDGSAASPLSAVAGTGLALETNGTPNGSQTLLNLVAGSNMTVTDDGFGNITFASTASGGGGSVTSFSAGNLSPLFTTSVATATTTPALSFTLSSVAAYTLFGNDTSGSAAPTFFSPVLASALFADQGTTHTLLHGNASGNPSWGAVDLTAEVTGILPVANGGLGVGTLTQYAVVLGNGASSPGFAIPATAGYVLTSNGASADPTFQLSPTNSGSVVAASGAQVTLSSPGTLATVTIPGGTLTITGMLKVRMYYHALSSGSVNNLGIGVSYGGTSVAAPEFTTTSDDSFTYQGYMELSLISNGATNSQIGVSSLIGGTNSFPRSTASAENRSTSAVDSTINQNLVISLIGTFGSIVMDGYEIIAFV